jgi:hypothetical protein
MSENQNQGAGEAKEVVGTLYLSLNRSNRQIREERGDALAEQIETAFRRHIEDLRYDLKDLKRKRSNMYDFSPTNSQSLVMAKDVEARSILLDDKTISIKIRNLEIELEIMEGRYTELTGKTLSE